MYLAYPPPDDEQLALCSEPLRAHMRELMKREPGRFTPPVRHRKPARVRRESQDPLRLAARPTARPAPAERRPAPDPQNEPERILRAALAAARGRGLTLDALAERAGLSGRTLRRLLRTPDTLPLGEYCRILRAANEEGEC